MKILTIGEREAGRLAEWEGGDVTHVSILSVSLGMMVEDAGMPAEWRGGWDVVWAENVLQRFSYWHTRDVLMWWAGCLVEGGVLHVITPSLEWCARQIGAEEPSAGLWPQLYGGQGGQNQMHLAGFTMRKLRVEMERAGLDVFRARSGKCEVMIGETMHEAQQHYVAGKRRVACGV